MSRQSTFEEQLEQYGYCVYFTVGSSMWPLLRPRKDLVHLKKPSGRLQYHDVALFRRKSGQYVLHRVVEVREKEYVFLGDHQVVKEEGIRDDQILGVMEGFTREGKYCTVDSIGYKVYVRLWTGLYPLRYISWKIRSVIKKRNQSC